MTRFVVAVMAAAALASGANAQAFGEFGMGTVAMMEGAKLTVAFDKAGEKKVIDTFVERG